MAADDHVEALVKQANVERLLALASSPDARVAKAARKGLHRLRSRGVDVAASAAPRKAHVPPPTSVAQELASLATSADGSGERLVWLVRRAQGGAEVFQARIHEVRGLLDFQAARWSLRRVRALRDDVLGMNDLPAAEVPSDFGHWLIEEGYERTLAARRTPPATFARARAELRAAPCRFDEHPARKDVEPATEFSERDAARLFAAPCCASWYPEPDQIDRLAMLIQEVDTSRLVLEPVQRTARRHAVVRRVAGEYFTPANRERYARRLLDAAYVVHRAGGPHAGLAPLLRRAADDLSDDERDAEEQAFAVGLFYRCLRPDSEAEQRPSQEGRLVSLADPRSLDPQMRRRRS